MDVTKLSCKNCKAPIREQNIRWDLALVRCDHCATVFSLTRSVGAAMLSRPVPSQMTVKNQDGAFQIDYERYRREARSQLYWIAGWHGGLLLLFLVALFTRSQSLALWGLPLLLGGIGWSYVVLVGLFNHTYFRVETGRLRLWHAPLPWPGGLDLPTREINQFYCRRNLAYGRKGPVETYEVYMALRNGMRQRLISRLPEPEQALFIEQALEEYLEIVDRRIWNEPQQLVSASRRNF